MAVAARALAVFASRAGIIGGIVRREPLGDTAEKHTVAMPFVQAAVARLGGAARERVLVEAGIPPGLLAAPDARVPPGAYSALWLAVARELDDEFFGLDRRRMKVGSFALLCQAVLSCENLERGVKRMLRGFAVFLDDVSGRLTVEGAEAVVRLDNRIQAEADRRFADETLLVLLHGLMCWLVGRRIPLGRVDFGYPRPPHAREYTLMFSEHVTFDAPQTALRFDAALLALPVVQTPATLQGFLRTAPQSVFLKYRNDDSWTARLRRRLRGSVAGAEPWPVFEEVARELETTPTTLRRRLEAEGTSYQGIKDQLRSDLAIDALCNSSVSIDDIAAQLGFLDSSAFHRAFKRWNGLQPGEYRRRQARS
ncbi:helix-turn-helix domain-containing protein [Ramlibacter sp. G-1-2-2]|uniref:Helix-turn-helix domain-containing protein n=1 Tax=Ramlibacter agri TaxID=2728837 RepID=A0A848HBK7_9BURK|nr:helix-turn-helix domain-containing protein [Ramlibacter agri]